MRRKLFFLVFILLGFSSKMLAFEYSYLSPIPKQYVKGYKFAFDVTETMLDNKIKTVIGISFRNIHHFESFSPYQYYSKWNIGLKGTAYYISDQKNNEFLNTDIGPVLGYDVTNHLNIYSSIGVKEFFNLKNRTNRSINFLISGAYGEVGVEYFLNENFVWFVKYQETVLTDIAIGNDKRYKELSLGIKFTFR